MYFKLDLIWASPKILICSKGVEAGGMDVCYIMGNT
jgi:hypothetical protein